MTTPPQVQLQPQEELQLQEERLAGQFQSTDNIATMWTNQNDVSENVEQNMFATLLLAIGLTNVALEPNESVKTDYIMKGSVGR